MEKIICTKCEKEYLEIENVWCNTCGCSYCKECAIVGLPKNFESPQYIEEQDLDDWQGDRGYTIEMCANCYKDYTDLE
ncbi:MAG: hypothetical protein J6D47_04100 [Peptostreptococcaceae bacterium]|nr:hypothetical protein [Peptostreptococcaceae bacterium]